MTLSGVPECQNIPCVCVGGGLLVLTTVTL